MNQTKENFIDSGLAQDGNMLLPADAEPDQSNYILDWLAPLVAECIALGEMAHSATDHLVNAVEICIALLSHDEATPAYGSRTLQAWQEQLAKAMLMSESEDAPFMGPVAIACGMSGRHFSRAFKATVGESPQRWRLTQRIEKAKLLMLRGGLSLTNIAYECGFAEQSHFNHTFYKITGESPGAWRRRQQAGQASSSDNGVRDAPTEQQPHSCFVG